VAVKIEGPNQPMYGRQLEDKDILYSMISRKSIDVLKEFYRGDESKGPDKDKDAAKDKDRDRNATKEDWKLIRDLKPLFDIP